MRGRPVIAAVCYALVAAGFFASAYIVSRDNARAPAVVFAIGAIAFLVMAILSALAASRSRSQQP